MSYLPSRALESYLLMVTTSILDEETRHGRELACPGPQAEKRSGWELPRIQPTSAVSARGGCEGELEGTLASRPAWEGHAGDAGGAALYTQARLVSGSLGAQESLHLPTEESQALARGRRLLNGGKDRKDQV